MRSPATAVIQYLLSHGLEGPVTPHCRTELNGITVHRDCGLYSTISVYDTTATTTSLLVYLLKYDLHNDLVTF